MTNVTPSTLEGKVALVTGASRGIGRAIALHLAAQGTSLFLTARDEVLLTNLARDIQEQGVAAAYLARDLREPDAATQIVDAALTRFGALDILINNAGATKRGSFLELSDADFHDGFALKFFGAVRLSRAAWPHLSARQGSIVNIAGVGGRTPGAAFTIGGPVNAALLSFTKALADQGIADGVQVNAVNPGAIRTDRLTKRLETVAEQEHITVADAIRHFVASENVTRIGEPEEIAQFVSYLVSPAGRFFHGALIDLDGGKTKTI